MGAAPAGAKQFTSVSEDELVLQLLHLERE